MKIFKLFKKIWNIVWPRQVVFHPLEEEIYITRKDDKHEIKMFFDPVTTEQKFNESTSLKDFITKIDKPE